MLAAAAVGCVLCAQSIERDGPDWVETVSGSVAVGGLSRVRVEARGLVLVQGGEGSQVTFVARSRVRAATREDARRVLDLIRPQARGSAGAILVMVPRHDLPIVTELEVRVPRALRAVDVATQIGDVILRDLPVEADVLTGGGRVDADRMSGRLTARTTSGAIRLGQLSGLVRAITGGGHIHAGQVGPDSRLETRAGEIFIDHAVADVFASTGAGNVQVMRAGGSVEAHTVGGMIRVREAGGIVSADNGGGITQVGSARGVRCESASGAIFASLFAGRPAASSILESGSGDITVMLPSNLSVTVQAVSDLGRMGGRMGGIVTEFPEIRAHQSGGRTVATGALNGGGPALKVAAARGVVYLKRQKP
jgi:hypothetical protein